MVLPWQQVVAYLAGVALQNSALVRDRVPLWHMVLRLSGLVGIGSLGFFLSLDGLAMGTVTYLAIFILLYRERMYPVIGEQDVYQVALIFWYIVLSHYGIEGFRTHPALWYALPLTIATIGVAWIRVQLEWFWKVIMYLWYMTMMTVIACLQFLPTTENFQQFFSYGIFNAFIGGIAICTTYTTAAMLLSLLLRQEERSETTVLRGGVIFQTTFTTYDRAVAQLFADGQLSRVQFAIITLLQGGLLGLNYVWQFIEPAIMINLSIAGYQGWLFLESRGRGHKSAP